MKKNNKSNDKMFFRWGVCCVPSNLNDKTIGG